MFKSIGTNDKKYKEKSNLFSKGLTVFMLLHLLHANLYSQTEEYKLLWDEDIQQTFLISNHSTDTLLLKVQHPRKGLNYFLNNDFIVIRSSDKYCLFNAKGKLLVRDACRISLEERSIKIKYCNHSTYYMDLNGESIKTYDEYRGGGPINDSTFSEHYILVYSGSKKNATRYEYALKEGVVNHFYYDKSIDSNKTLYFRLYNLTGGPLSHLLLENGRGIEVTVMDTGKYTQPGYPIHIKVDITLDIFDAAIRFPYILNGKREEIWLYIFTNQPKKKRFIEITYQGDNGERNRMSDPINGYRLYINKTGGNPYLPYITQECQAFYINKGVKRELELKKDYVDLDYFEINPEHNSSFTLEIQHDNWGTHKYFISRHRMESSAISRTIYIPSPTVNGYYYTKYGIRPFPGLNIIPPWSNKERIFSPLKRFVNVFIESFHDPDSIGIDLVLTKLRLKYNKELRMIQGNPYTIPELQAKFKEYGLDVTLKGVLNHSMGIYMDPGPNLRYFSGNIIIGFIDETTPNEAMQMLRETGITDITALGDQTFQCRIDTLEETREILNKLWLREEVLFIDEETKRWYAPSMER